MIPQEESKGVAVAPKAGAPSMLDNLMAGLKLDITKKAEASKDQQEFASKLRQLEGKSDA